MSGTGDAPRTCVCVCVSVLARVANRSSFQTTTTAAAAAVAAADVHDVRTREPRAARGQTFITIPNRPPSWWRGSVVERRSLAGELSLSCARPAADG